MTESTPSTGVPTTVRVAGALVALQGAVAVVVAAVLLFRSLLGHEDAIANGYATSLWFGLLGAAVLAAGAALGVGKRWGRAIAIVMQILLLPVAWSLLTGSHQPLLGSILGVVVIAALLLLISRPTAEWMDQGYGDGDGDSDDGESSAGDVGSGNGRARP